MSLVSNISDLATSMATAVKGVKTLVNGNASDLSGLTTTTKTNLVAAVNEVAASVGSAAGIDDVSTSTTSTWSSSKTASEIGTASTADRARANHTGTQSADTVVDGTTNKAYTATEKTKLAGIATGATANSTDATLLARANHTGTQTAATISDFQATVDARISSVLDIAGAPTTLDTLNELAAALGDDPNYAATTATALGNRVRVDAAQAFTGPQQAQGRTNIGAQAASEIGDTTTNFATTFEAGLV